MIVERLAENITEFFISKGIIDANRRDIYEYGFAHILSETVSWIILFAIALLVKQFIESTVYFAVFMILRHSAGGYHASTRLRCQAIFIGAYLIFLMLIYIIPAGYILFISMPVAVFCITTMSVICPIDNEKKRLTDLEKAKYKKKTIILLLSFTGLMVFMLFMDLGYIALSIVLAMLNVCISDIAGMFQRMEE